MSLKRCAHHSTGGNDNETSAHGSGEALISLAYIDEWTRRCARSLPCQVLSSPLVSGWDGSVTNESYLCPTTSVSHFCRGVPQIQTMMPLITCSTKPHASSGPAGRQARPSRCVPLSAVLALRLWHGTPKKLDRRLRLLYNRARRSWMQRIAAVLQCTA